MTFKLSQRSLNNLKGVDERLQRSRAATPLAYQKSTSA
jgi:hypothetical protein